MQTNMQNIHPLFYLAQQLMVVIIPDWDCSQGILARFEKVSPTSQWQPLSRFPVTIGKKGMSWGLGLYPQEPDALPSKREGDLTSPAGIFSLGTAFGDLSHACFAKHMPFLLIKEDLECIDDPQSSRYNQFVYANSIEERDWTSSEKMMEWIDLYKIGLMIHHNTNPAIPYKGSCIFMHIWRNEQSGTAGCTAMDESHLQELISWLDMRKQPLLVQLPLSEYQSRQQKWGLPAFA
jgi:L,D-peptidoglycan transpeptidase YkuD (ErfK/YbiS/YcfS/YnhG family)